MNFLLSLIAIVLVFSCGKNADSDLPVAGFTVEKVDENNYNFSNTSKNSDSNKWDLGNGIVIQNKANVSAFYPNAGTYNVSLTAYNKTDKDVYFQKITVASNDLTANFSYQKVDANTYSFSNTSVGNYDSLLWNFDNGQTSTLQNPSSVYFPFKGNYTVVLTIIKGNTQIDKSVIINIASDDPNYLSKMTLTWSDEFDGTALNQSFWTYETGASGWGNNEWQNYTAGDNAVVANGELVITAKLVGAGQKVGDYTSTRIISKGKKEFTYGRMEARIKLPSGRGTWPAFWMLGANISTVGWPLCGEIDIMEHVGYNPNYVSSALHTKSSFGNTVNFKELQLPTAENQYHVYGFIWTSKEMRFYVDDPSNIFYTYAPGSKNEDNWPFDKAQFFLLNLAIGGNWGGQQGVDDTAFPMSMHVDYVRVYDFK